MSARRPAKGDTVNGTRIAYQILVWLAAVLAVILLPAVIAMLVQIVFTHWFAVVIFLVVIVGFPMAAHIESKR
jgi:uncharacterized membrane protein